MEIAMDGASFDTVTSFFPSGREGGDLQIKRLFLQNQPAARTVVFKSLDSDTFDIDYLLYAR
jgi:hypothetical protein